MKNSKFIQLDANVLMEYIYDDAYLRADDYIISKNLTDNTLSFSVSDETGLNNRISNQFVVLDPVRNLVGVKNPETYNFLLNREYIQNLPIAQDRIKIHFPINYNFSEYAGCYLKVHALTNENQNIATIVQYFFDKQDQTRFNTELEISSPPESVNGITWGKYIEVSFPSVNVLASQRVNNITTSDTINYNLTSGEGLSMTAPIMLEFGFLTSKIVTNNVSTYLLGRPLQTSVPITPDFQNMAVKIEHSSIGDWFDIYGTYNGNISEFNKFINNSVSLGKRYYVEYLITLFEENVRGKTMNITVNSDFNEKVEYRPIIKYSSTTAVIEVTMRVVDAVDGSAILRTSSYGMLSKEVNKYSRSLVKINTLNTKTPRIYNLRSGASINDAISGLNKRTYDNMGMSENLEIEIVKVPYPVMVNTNNIVAKSESSLLDSKEWKGNGKLKLVINPFDNIMKFVLAKSVENKVEYYNLLSVGTINLKFKNFDSEVSTELYRTSNNEIDLEKGTIVFRLKKESVNSVRRIFQSGVNVFYITSTSNETGETSVIYQGTFIMSDSIEYVNNLAKDYQDENSDVEIRRDTGSEYAVVTRRSASDSNLTLSNSSQVISDINLISDVNTTFTLVNDPITGRNILGNL